jgi:hypothetical protein
MPLPHGAHRRSHRSPGGAVRARAGCGIAARAARDSLLAPEPQQHLGNGHPGGDPGRRVGVARRPPGVRKQPRARGGASRARPPGGRERALPHRSRSARPARPFVDDDHGQGGAGAPARRGRPGPVPARDRRGGGPGETIARRRASRGRQLPRRDARRGAGDRARVAAGRRHRRRSPARRRCRRPFQSGAVRLDRAGGADDNVVRHAHANSCSVRLSRGCVEIVDDGVGANGGSGSGSGLAGLRERVAAAGGVVDAGPVQPKGWRLRVSLAPEAVA